MSSYRESLQKKYEELWNLSKESILKNNIEIDKHLTDIEADKRLGLSLIIPITGSCLDNFLKVIRQLKKIEPDQYYYPPTDIHVTVLGFTIHSEDFVFNEREIKVYKKILDKVLQNVPKFNIKFKGLTTSKGAVMVQGFFDETLQEVRKNLKKEINNHGIELKERYKLTVAHCTIMRFKQKLQNPEQLVKKIEELQNQNFGVFEADKFLFVVHDWYTIKEKTKILGKYELN